MVKQKQIRSYFECTINEIGHFPVYIRAQKEKERAVKFFRVLNPK